MSDDANRALEGGSAAGTGMIGQVIDKRYKIIRKLGEGGMGEVYAADHLRINRSLAIKLLRAEVLANEEAVLRFEQEAMTASSIGHRNIIRIEDSGKLDDGRIYLAMELLDGLPFNELIETKTVSPERLLHIVIQTCRGLRAAHDQNIVHRDMKPENIYITRGPDGADLPKLLDFGIAKVSQTDGENHLTRTGTIFGTPYYMAPEQALGQTVDFRVDIYAMGVIMYEIFTGEVPFGGESFMGILTKHITAEPPLPSVTAQKNGRVLGPEIESVILRAMKKDPSERYQRMSDLIEALIPLQQSISGSGSMVDGRVTQGTAPPEAEKFPSHEVGGAMTAPDEGGGAHAGRVHAARTPLVIAAQGAAAPLPDDIHHDGTSQGAEPVMPAAGTSVSFRGSPANDDAHLSDSLLIPATKKRTGVYILLGLVPVLGALVFYLSTSADDELGGFQDAGMAGPVVLAKADATTEVVQDQPVGGGEKDASVAADASGPEVPSPSPQLKRVVVTSQPRGALLYQEGEKPRKTPRVIAIKGAEPVTIVLKKRGYQDQKTAIDGTEAAVTIHLERKRRKTHAPPAPVEVPAVPPVGEGLIPDTTDPKQPVQPTEPANPKKPTIDEFCERPENALDPRCALE